MKTNFKKLAMVAGVTAVLAGGSMSAHAVIQAVPAPAALIPLFTTGNAGQTALLRVQVPASVGLDDVNVIFGGPTAQPLNQSTANPNLAGSTTAARGSALSQIHWIHMDPNSNEVNNGKFPVSANDVVEMTSDAMIWDGAQGTIALAPRPGYLVLVNESATREKGAGAPLFSFTAEAYIVDGNVGIKNGVNGVNSAYNIPVFPLTDSADGTSTAPSLFNNVVEAYPKKVVGSPYGNGPIVSPLVSGIRTASTAGGVRVVDLPLYNVDDQGINTYVVWNDRNGIYDGLDGNASLQTPGLTGSTYLFDRDENQLSADELSLDSQLSILDIEGDFQGNHPLFNGKTPHRHIFPEFENAGFLRWVIEPGVNYGNIANGAYAAAVIFRLPTNPTLDAPAAFSAVNSPVNDGYSVFPVDRGFFQN